MGVNLEELNETITDALNAGYTEDRITFKAVLSLARLLSEKNVIEFDDFIERFQTSVKDYQK